MLADLGETERSDIRSIANLVRVVRTDLDEPEAISLVLLVMAAVATYDSGAELEGEDRIEIGLEGVLDPLHGVPLAHDRV